MDFSEPSCGWNAKVVMCTRYRGDGEDSVTARSDDELAAMMGTHVNL